MKELTSIEMKEISGAGILSFLNGEQSLGVALVDAVVGGIYGAVVLSAQGGLQGGVTGNGTGGGMLGVGAVMAWTGSIWASVQGGVWGAVIGAYEGTAAIDDRTRIFFDSVVFGTGGGFKN